MFGVMPLVGAYGRDYQSEKAAKDDFMKGLDFRSAAGPYCSLRDFKSGDEITIRYRNLRKAFSFIL